MEIRRTIFDIRNGEGFTTEARRHGAEKRCRTTEYTEHKEMLRRGSRSEQGRNARRANEHDQGWPREVSNRLPLIPYFFRVFRGSLLPVKSAQPGFDFPLFLSVPLCLRGESFLGANRV